MKLIGLTGLPRSGKDTFARRLVENHSYAHRAFATPLKAAAAILLGHEVWEMNGEHGFDREAILPEWGFSTREFLQKFGTECLRDQIRQDFWIKHMQNRLQGVDKAVITDVRFENEAALVRSMGGKILEIWRPGVTHNAHVSNQYIVPDYRVDNRGTLMELWEHADAHA